MDGTPTLPLMPDGGLLPAALLMRWLERHDVRRVHLPGLPPGNHILPDLLHLGGVTELVCDTAPLPILRWEGAGGSRILLRQPDDDSPSEDAPLHCGALPGLAGFAASGQEALLGLLDLARLEDASAAVGAGDGASWDALLAERNEELRTLVHQRTEALELSNLALTTISTTDHLTGLRNRRYLAEELPSVLARALRAHHDHAAGGARATEACLVFAMLDLDHFKRVNDTWSHATGDRVLREVAETLKHEARGSDFLIRWGGEEILFVGPVQDLDGAAAAVARLHQAIAGHSFNQGQATPLALTCSIGFSVFPFQPDHLEGDSWEDLVRVADRCLYAVKHSGRDGWLGVVGRVGSAPGLARAFDQGPLRSIQTEVVELRASRPPGGTAWEQG